MYAQNLDISGTITFAGALSGITTISTSGSITTAAQLISTIATGTAPLVVSSTTKVTNLNADTLDGSDWAAPASIGSGTPAAGAFTTLSASGQITSTVITGTAPLVISSTTAVANLNASLLLGSTWAIPGTIGSTTPNTAAFSSLTVGTSGTAITQIRKISASLTPSSVATVTVAEQSFTFTGAATSDTVVVTPPSISTAVGLVGARVSALDTISIRWVNPTAGSLTPTAGTYIATLFRS